MGDMIGGLSQMLGGILSASAANKARKGLDRLKWEDPVYEASPYAKNTLGLAQTLLNSRMAGSEEMARNTYGAQANTISNINRNATDSSQALALAAGAQGQTDAAFDSLHTKEAQDSYNKINNLNNANQGMTAEHQAMFDDNVRRWMNKVNINQAKFGMAQVGAQSAMQIGQGLAMATRDRGGEAVMGAAQGALSSAGSSAGGVIGGMFSDKRLKHNYHIVGKSPSGINIYEFSYNGSNGRYIGVMADEVKDAAFMTDSGYLAVDYKRLM